MFTCVPWEKQLWYWHSQESVAEVFFPNVCVLKEFLTDRICTQYIPICVCRSWTVLESSRIHLFPKELCLDQIGFMCACPSAETLLAGCGSFPPDCLDSMGSRRFPTEQLWLGENPGVFLTEYLWDWQGPGHFLCFLFPGIIITYIICMYFRQLCFVPGKRSAAFNSHKDQLHLEIYGQD